MSTTGAAGVVQMLVSLLLVLGLVFGLAWMLRRVQGLRTGKGSSLRVQAGVQVGARERVLLVQAGDTHLLIGVAPGRVNLLHRFDGAPDAGFAEALQRAHGDAA